jgi:T6SS, Phospholipase effector Tle1-like, catalytic domain
VTPLPAGYSTYAGPRSHGTTRPKKTLWLDRTASRTGFFDESQEESAIRAGKLLPLLRPDQLNLDLAGYALAAYKRASEKDDLSVAWHFRRVVGGRAAPIRFIGVWNTAASVLVPWKDRFYIPSLQMLPYTRSNPSVAVFRQAIAIDERRRMFRLNRWNGPQEFRAGARNGHHGTRRPV